MEHEVRDGFDAGFDEASGGGRSGGGHSGGGGGLPRGVGGSGSSAVNKREPMRQRHVSVVYLPRTFSRAERQREHNAARNSGALAHCCGSGETAQGSGESRIQRKLRGSFD